MYRCFPYDIEIIISNLITNSVAVLAEKDDHERTINIILSEKDDIITLDYSDNGPGLPTVYKREPNLILEPFESSKTNELGEPIGTGMGMWLIKRTVSDYNGSIDLARNKTEAEGFFISLKLPKK
jgi:sensor histidine kinase regulating citrate/malate metabolism